MYNRYIPQSDGSYRRSRIPEPSMPKPHPQPSPHSSADADQKPVSKIPLTPQNPPRFQPSRPAPQPKKRKTEPMSIPGFLRQLLPKNFDTEDLLIVLLLLLMSGDCQEDQNTALLTLGIYLFM